MKEKLVIELFQLSVLLRVRWRTIQVSGTIFNNHEMSNFIKLNSHIDIYV